MRNAAKDSTAGRRGSGGRVDPAATPSGRQPLDLIGGQSKTPTGEDGFQSAGERPHRSSLPTGLFQEHLGVVGVFVVQEPHQLSDHGAGASE